MAEVRRRTTGRQQGFDPASGLSGADGIEAFARRNRQGSSGTTGDPQRLTQFDIQQITPDGSTPVAGSPIGILPGSWLLSITVGGNYDHIYGGVVYEVDGPGGGSIGAAWWLAHRPEGDINSVAGSMTVFPVSNGIITPAIAVSGSGEDDVTILVRFDPCETS